MSVTAPELGCPSGLAPAGSPTEELSLEPFVHERSGSKHLELSITGAKCAGCIAKIESAVQRLPGIESVRLNLSTGTLSVQWQGSLAASRIGQTLQALGYPALPFDPGTREKQEDDQGQFLLKCLGVAGFAAMNIMLLSVSVWSANGDEMGEATRSLIHLISALIAIPTVAYSGRPFFRSAYAALKSGHANMDVPISLAVFLALGVSMFESLAGGEHAYFDAAVMLLFFLLIGRWLDHRLRQRAHAAASDLLALQATTALRELSDGSVETIAARDIRPGDLLVIRPGTRLPVNAQVVRGQSDIDVSFLTGESLPQVVREGGEVFAGTQNISQRLTVRATADVSGSLVADLVRLMEAGQQSKEQYTVLADKAARAYVPIVHTLAVLTFLGWLILAGSGLREAVMAATAVLIITCPCALGLATPAVQVVATGQLFRRGILVKSGNALERLAKARHIVFDKTGTLTVGELAWTNREAIPADDRKKLAALARAGLHPIARAIAAVEGAGPLALDTDEIPGQGLRGVIDGVEVRLGSASFVGAANHPAAGPTSWFKMGSTDPVLLTFQDQVHTDGQDTINALDRSGLSVSLLSGDRAQPVAEVAQSLGIADHRAGLSPQDKAEIIGELREEHGPIAMIGDGLNDAAALSLADVSLAPGSAADAAQSAAAFVFQKDGVGSVYQAWHMARRARQHILQNFGFAVAYNAVAAPLAMAGLVTPLIAALAMSGSSVVVTLNAMRLMRGGPKVS